MRNAEFGMRNERQEANFGDMILNSQSGTERVILAEELSFVSPKLPSDPVGTR